MTDPACPLCGKPAAPGWRPFCSRAHRDRDLNAWFGEDYRIPDRTPAGLDSADDAD